MPLSRWTFPVPCLRCGLIEAEPIETHTPTGGNHIEITIRCMSCLHEWRESFEFPAVFMPELPRRPDRLKGNRSS